MKADVSRFKVKMLATTQYMNSDVYASRKAQALFLMSLQFWVTPKLTTTKLRPCISKMLTLKDVSLGKIGANL